MTARYNFLNPIEKARDNFYTGKGMQSRRNWSCYQHFPNPSKKATSTTTTTDSSLDKSVENFKIFQQLNNMALAK